MNKIKLSDGDLYYEIESEKPISPKVLLQFPKYSIENKETPFKYSFPPGPTSSFILDVLIKKFNFDCSKEALTMIEKFLPLSPKPKVFLFDDTHLGIEYPSLPFYKKVAEKLSAAPKSYTIGTIAFSRAYEVLRLISSIKTWLPEFTIEDTVKEKLLTPLDSFDGTLPSLLKAEASELTTSSNAYRVPVENFEKAGYLTIYDLILKRPKRYIDKTKTIDRSNWIKGEDVTFLAKISDKKVIRNQHTVFELNLPDDTKVKATFYRRAWMESKYFIGEEVLVIGRWDGRQLSGTSIDSLLEANSLPIIPIYPQSSKLGINTKLLMNCMYEIFERYSKVSSNLITYIESNNPNMNMAKAIKELHFPTSSDGYIQALEVLAYYELIYMQLLILDRKATEIKAQGTKKPHQKGKTFDLAIEGLPFDLTDSQKKALVKLNKTLSTNTAEEVLISADVGSGKTLIAQLTCLQAVDNDYQAVLAGPTEVLAKQLYNTFTKLIDKIPQEIRPSIVYLSGETKAREKKQIFKSIEYGEVDIIVGTHSVFSESVPYSKLGVVVVDEQQKFGAAQRTSLQDRGAKGTKPDIITQTATPIPRSTAQVFYGDIDLITIDEKPKGRLPIITEWIKNDPKEIIKDKTHKIWKDIMNETKEGHQTFVVVPMVYENDKLNVASVEDTVKQLTKILPNAKIEFIHGQMKKDLQSEKMQIFRDKKADILVASTVIEVGVDVEAATRVLILSADRIGASSLHQIRGRVGRNSLQSKCYLISNNEREATAKRLNSLVESNSGFDIATVDLHTRGEGDLFGSKQAGETNFHFINLVDHSKLIKEAHSIAEELYSSPKRYEAMADAKSILGINE